MYKYISCIHTSRTCIGLLGASGFVAWLRISLDGQGWGVQKNPAQGQVPEHTEVFGVRMHMVTMARKGEDSRKNLLKDFL